MTKCFLISLEMPEHVTILEMKQYIKEAVQTDNGRMDPETNPLTKLDRASVKVKHVKYQRKIITEQLFSAKDCLPCQ